jgi:hypothetical protein
MSKKGHWSPILKHAEDWHLFYTSSVQSARFIKSKLYKSLYTPPRITLKIINRNNSTVYKMLIKVQRGPRILHQSWGWSQITTDNQSAVCLGVRHPSGKCDQFFFLLEIFFRQLRVCYFVAPSLTRGRVCKLLLLLILASAVPLGSESRRT